MLKNRVIYIIVTLLAWAASRFFGAQITALYALIGFALAAATLVWFAPRFLCISQRVITDAIHKNDTAVYELSYSKAAALLFPGIRLAFFGNTDTLYEKTGSGVYNLTFAYRGRYRVGLSKVSIPGPLGLFTRGFKPTQTLYITVFPARIQGFSLPLTARLLTTGQAGTGNAATISADGYDVRKYAYGDDYRRVHWKLTAKRNELIVKEYYSATLNETLIFLDTAQINGQGADLPAVKDALASAAVSAAFYCLQNRQSAWIFTADTDTRIETAADYELLLRRAAEADFDADEYLPAVLRTYIKTESRYNIAVIVYNISDALFVRLCELAALSHNVIVFAFNADTQQTQRLAQAGVQVIETGL